MKITKKGRLLLEAHWPKGVSDKRKAMAIAIAGIQRQFNALPLKEARQQFAESFGSEWFPSITLDAVNKAMIEGYGPEPLLWMPLVKQTTAKDFRTQYEIAKATFPDLDQVQPGGSYREVFLEDEQANWSLSKYGNLFSVDLETIADDELGALMDAVREWGESVKRTKNEWFWTQQVEGNPQLYDGTVLFHTSHNNITTSAALAEGTLRAMIAKMRRQTGRNGEKIHLMPKYLVVPPELHDLAVRLVKSPTLIALEGTGGGSALTGQTNTIAGHGIEVISHPYFVSATDWYLFASRPGFKFGTFRGQPGGPKTFREVAGTGAEFEQDRMRFKIRDFWGGTWVDYRFAQKGVA